MTVPTALEEARRSYYTLLRLVKGNESLFKVVRSMPRLRFLDVSSCIDSEDYYVNWNTRLDTRTVMRPLDPEHHAPILDAGFRDLRQAVTRAYVRVVENNVGLRFYVTLERRWIFEFFVKGEGRKGGRLACLEDFGDLCVEMEKGEDASEWFAPGELDGGD